MPLDLSDVAIVDGHAHNLLRPHEARSFQFTAAFTEAYDPEVVERQVAGTLFFRRSLRDLAVLLECAPDLASVLAVRERLGYDGLAERCFRAGRFASLLLDDGLSPDKLQPISWHARFGPVHRILRVEHLAEQLLTASTGWAEFSARLGATLDQPGADVVGFKSIVAYRTGLAIEPPDEAATAEAFNALRQQIGAGDSVRLAQKPLNDWLVWTALESAGRRGLPLQLHSGFGDPDLDLRLANPLHLRPLLESPAGRSVRLVLLHAAYPYTREAGYLASVYPNVHLDLGLAVPFLSVSGMRSALAAALELAPISKIMFSTDAHFIPDLFYLGALWGRRIIAEVLEAAVRDGDLTAAEAEEAGAAILAGNAADLYGV